MKSLWMSFFLVLTVGCSFTANLPDTQLPNGDGTSSSGDGDGDGAGKVSASGFALCSASNKCPAGQWCFNGLCSPGCNSNQDCADDQYCDTQDFQPYYCKNKTVSRCPEVPCAQSQECINGLCSAKLDPATPACTPSPTFNDSCDKYSVCFDTDEEGPKPAACMSFPPCPEDGICPVGMEGAVCNDGYIPSKGRFCMPGTCADATHCPKDYKCVKQTSNQPLGFCSAGGPNMPCFQSADCLSNSCFLPGGAGFMGFCQ